MEKLAHGWSITSWALYVAIGLILQAEIRLFMSILSAWYLYRTRQVAPGDLKPRCLKLIWHCFTGIHPKESVCRDDSDYALPVILGVIEQFSYPIIMAVGAWTVIGAWLGFKTIAHWHRWSSDRFTFNRYLIGNALVVATSFVFMVPYVEV